MYMNLKPNQHKRISFNTSTMTSLGFIRPHPKILGPPLNLAQVFSFLLRSYKNHKEFSFINLLGKKKAEIV